MRAIRLLGTGVALWALAAFLAPAAGAVQSVRITTPYPAVVVEPGGSTTFDINVFAPGRQRVDLDVVTKPKGWSALLRGGGFLLNGVYTDPVEPPEVQLEVEVPEGAEPGTYRVEVVASGASGSDTLALDLRVSRSAEGSLGLSTEFPALRGPADAVFTFDLTLSSNIPQETSFALDARGPEGWQVEARSATEEQATTVTVAGGDTARIQVEADPPDDVVAGRYPILVSATGGGQAIQAELQVEITGTFSLTITTPDERLNTEVTQGSQTEFPVVVVNDGTAPLTEITLEATSPSGWEVEFRPSSIAQLLPGETARATAVITPSDEAVAGDYVITMRADVPEASSEMDVRTTVKTSSLWGVVGILLIAAALGGLGYVFRRYGRR